MTPGPAALIIVTAVAVAVAGCGGSKRLTPHSPTPSLQYRQLFACLKPEGFVGFNQDSGTWPRRLGMLTQGYAGIYADFFRNPAAAAKDVSQFRNEKTIKKVFYLQDGWMAARFYGSAAAVATIRKCIDAS